MVSYSSSPAFEVPKGSKESNTAALLDTCFRQVEYAGVIAGAQNEVGARKFIDFMLTRQVQADIPGQMYMYPADTGVALPKDRVATPHWPPARSTCPPTPSPRTRTWIRQWTVTVVG